MTHDTLRAKPRATASSTSVARPASWANSLGVLTLVLCTPLLAQASSLKDKIAQARTAKPQGPCPFFDVAVVHKVFPHSSNEAQFKSRDKPYPSCTYIWTAKNKSTMKMAGREVQVPSEGRLTLTKAPSRVAANDWERVLMGYKNQQLTPVPELGQYAVWSAQRRQLSWIAKGHVFHVAVEDADQPETQQKSAMAVAAELIRTH